MIDATSITLSYSEVEDRVFADASDGRITERLILTRRISRRLLSAFVNLLERSSATAKRAPLDMRNDVIALEHLSAVSQPPEKGAPAKAGPNPAPVEVRAAVVLTKVDVQVLPRAFRLVFHSAREPVASLTINRLKFHKLLAALDRFATTAEWNIRDPSEWLDADKSGAKRRLAS
jgi:hypothetical protein